MYVLKRYKYVIICALILLIMYIVNREIGSLAIIGTINNVWELIKLVPPVFVLLGLMDIWIPKEKMMRFLGEESGLKGGAIAFIIGSFAAGPIYAAFPVAAMLIRKGSSMRNVMIFTGSWASTKVPMLLIEISSLGLKFTVIRLVVEIAGIVIIAFLIDRSLSKEEKEIIYKNSKKL
jgi:uncharacterized membrane protein YraQ (UPF0718 family)